MVKTVCPRLGDVRWGYQPVAAGTKRGSFFVPRGKHCIREVPIRYNCTAANGFVMKPHRQHLPSSSREKLPQR